MIEIKVAPDYSPDGTAIWISRPDAITGIAAVRSRRPGG